MYRDRARRCHSHLNEPIQRTKSAQATHHERVLGKAKTLVGCSRTPLTVVPHIPPPPFSLPTHKLVAAFTCYVKALYFFFSCFFMFSDDLRLTSYSDLSKLSYRRIELDVVFSNLAITPKACSGHREFLFSSVQRTGCALLVT